jgi:hypothetical protein
VIARAITGSSLATGQCHRERCSGYPEPNFFAARLSVRRSLSVFCGCFFGDFFGFSERFAITAS